ncbi:MAG: hypothetical protein GY765_40750 [bacterium]|nr:hypothetical protein [bacterium]
MNDKNSDSSDSDLINKTVVIVIIAIFAPWIVIYAVYLSGYVRGFFFDVLGVPIFPAIFHAVPLLGIPILLFGFIAYIWFRFSKPDSESIGQDGHEQ